MASILYDRHSPTFGSIQRAFTTSGTLQNYKAVLVSQSTCFLLAHILYYKYRNKITL